MAGKRCEEVDVAIVGAGIAGLGTAVALRKVGAKSVVVLERAAGLRATGAALVLWPNAWRALAALGVAHKLTPLYPTFQKGLVTNLTTGAMQEVSFRTSRGSGGVGVRPVLRRVLLESLAEELPPNTIRFSVKLTSIATQNPGGASSGVVLHLDDGTAVRTKALIGCDGVHSAVAQWLGLSSPVNSGRAAARGLAVLPDGHGISCELQQLLGKSARGGFIPINDTEIFWFVTDRSKPTNKETARDPELTVKHVTETMAEDFPPWSLDVVRHSDPSTLSWAPLMLRLPWDVVFGPTHKGNVAVAGDAMHPMTPDLGQGGCAALEDAVVLGRNLAACLRLDGSVATERVAGCLAAYVKERQWRGAGLIAGAYVLGWMQQGGSAWWESVVKFVRDSAFYRFVFPKVASAVADYDCGCLPTAMSTN